MHSEPRMNSLANISRILVCVSVFAIIAAGYFGSASTVETAETVAPPTRTERVVAPPAPIAPSGAVPFDFDGDGKTDIGRWHSASTEYKVWKSGSSEYQTTTIGTSSAKAISGDFDNDNKYDVGTFAAGAWNIKKSSDGNTISTSFGTTGDIPVAGDFGGNGTSDCAVFRPSTSVWWILPDCTGSYSSTSYGTSGDIPVTGDYDGDGKTDIAVFRPSTGYWYANRSAAGSLAVQWGVSTDVPMSADFDEDGSDDLVIFRPSSGTWYVLFSDGDFTSYSSNVWGNWYDQPVPGDYDGDGITDRAIWRQTTSEWWIEKSSGGTLTYTLGVPGDTAIPSVFVKQVGGTASGYELATARLDPENATGGTDVYSRNFSWGTSLVSLPGRSGLDAGLGLSYNSLVWIKTGGSMYFDPDSSNVAPGFRLGLPTIEPIYYNDSRSKWAYMMVTPSGKRVEFVETSVDELFITTDSSYTQLVTGTTTAPNVPSEGVTMTVKTTDGTQMSYVWNTGAYRCTKIKDRNGNYIEIAYSEYGQITSVTDTLGRVINVVYDEYGRVWKIQQTWKGTNGSGSDTTHTYATLTYTTKTVATSWGVSFYGPPNDTAVTVLDKVIYADGSATKFDYNGYIQVKKVTNIAADTTTNLNYVETDLANVSGSQSDVPRVGETRNWAKDFNVISGTATAVVVTNSAPTSATYTIDGVTATGTKIDVGVTGHPDSLFTRYWFHSSGYKKGLPIGTEDCVSSTCTGTDRKRWTSTDWTQDNTSVSYIVNPRVIGSKVGDTSNTKKSEIEYWLYENTTVAVSGLVKESRIYDTDGTTVLKKAYTEYNLASDYTTRNIIGLPSMTLAYGRDEYGLQLVGKTTYAYDEGNFSGTGQTISPTKHDGTNYGSSFVVGRGNVTTVKRWDATAPTTVSTESTLKYNTAGSVVSRTTPWDGTNTRTVSISYTDVWNSSGNPTTYAYPTEIKDPANNASTVKYRYDIGANVEATSPAPAGQTYGKTSKRLYDSIGRLERDSVYVNSTEKFYTRYEFPTNGVQTQSYTTVTDVDGDNNISEDEVYSESWLDGGGRVLRSRTEHPGSTGGWSAVQTTYDMLGQTASQSVPTEVSVSGSTWTPAGDDATRGFIYSYTYYDWKGRTIRTVPTDSNGSDGKDTLISYEGCGCAGGQVTTIQGPSVAKDVGTGNARRVQKIYEDILGRSYLTEVYGWDGTSVYTSTEQKFNGRDQVTRTRQYSGNTSSSIYQDVTMTYDGFGRMATRHYPIEDSGTYTSWSYNKDDSISQIIDPRLAIQDFTYNNVGAVTQIAYTPPANYPPANSPAYMNIDDTPTVNFTYDNLGNRTSMTDGLGEVEYEYDPLSRLTAETRYFTDSLADAPTYQSQQAFRLTYEYDTTGTLRTVTDPYGSEVEYSRDKVARLTAVDGSAFGNNTTGDYVSGIKYRAFGSAKEVTTDTDDDAVMTILYDNGLRPSLYQVTTSTVSGGYLKKSTFDYNADASIQSMTDVVNSSFNRTYKYDHMSRLSSNRVTPTAYATEPYTQSITYDAFSQMTSRSTNYWGATGYFSSTYTNGRETTSGVSGTAYDAAGNQYNAGTRGNGTYQTRAFDASGRNVSFENKYKVRAGRNLYNTVTRDLRYDYDGDGHQVRQRVYVNGTQQTGETKLQIWSSVLGMFISETNQTGAKVTTKVTANGSVIAEQLNYAGTNDDVVVWMHADPVSGSSSRTHKDGTLWYRTEYEPLGQEINVFGTDEEFPDPPDTGSLAVAADDPQWQCQVSALMNESYFEKPVHCRRAVHVNGEFEDFLPWVKVFDPSKIPDGASNTLGFAMSFSPSGNVLAFSKKSTKKSEKDAESNGPSCPDGTSPVYNPSSGTFECVLADAKVDETVNVNIAESSYAYSLKWKCSQAENGYGKWMNCGETLKAMDPVASRFSKQEVADALNVCGIGASIGEYSNVLNGRWRVGTTWYNSNFYGNQYVTKQSVVAGRAATFNMVGKVTFAGGAVLSASQVATGEISPARGALDVTMGYVGVFGGPKGAVVSGAYFVYNAIPPPTYGKHGAGMYYPLKINSCHGNQ